jgi:hypothetical protein
VFLLGQSGSLLQLARIHEDSFHVASGANLESADEVALLAENRPPTVTLKSLDKRPKEPERCND